ncbi:MAG: inner membrane protein YpjD [Chitinophagales bacterium]
MLIWAELSYRGAAILLAVAFLVNLGTLFARRRAHSVLGMIGSRGGWALLTASLVLRTLAAHRFPVQNQFEATSLFLWACLTAFVYLEWRLKWSAMNVAFLFLGVGALVYSLWLPRTLTPELPALRHGWLPVHVTLNFAAYAALTLAFVLGLLYLGQQRQLKRKRISFLYYLLPPLDRLEEMVDRLVRWGFPLLTLGIMAGAINAQLVWGAYWDWRNPKMIWSLILWALYGLYFYLRAVLGWRGRRTVLWVVISFLAVVVNYGISLAVHNPHSFAQQFIK